MLHSKDKRNNYNRLFVWALVHYSNSEMGDLRECTNWRGITLLSIPGIIMAKVMLKCMGLAVDERLRQKQAGFRPGRSCCEQIFTLRQNN